MPPLLNPYADLVQTLFASKIDPESLEASRKKLIWAYSWAIPSPEASGFSDSIQVGSSQG